MNGPQHYAEAEKMLRGAAQLTAHAAATRDRPGASMNAAGHLLKEAQVHATLALVAATASARVSVFIDDAPATLLAEQDRWNEVIASE